MSENNSSNKNNGEDKTSPQNIKLKKNKSKKSNDSKDDSIKERKTLNISLQKRNIDNLNSIIDNWEEDGLVVSNEVCKAILFKNDFENNSCLQTFLSTLNLIKTNLSNKNLFDKSYNEALTIALKNILNIKINASELVSLLEDDSYFKPGKDNNISINSSIEVNNKEHYKSNNTSNKTINTNSESTLKTKSEIISNNISSANYETTKPNTITTSSKKESLEPLVWTLPDSIKNNENTNANSKNKDINKMFDAFDYNI